jgi:hypothetical protein
MSWWLENHQGCHIENYRGWLENGHLNDFLTIIMLTDLPSSFEFPSMHMVLDDSRISVSISLCLANKQHLRRLIKFSEAFEGQSNNS